MTSANSGAPAWIATTRPGRRFERSTTRWSAIGQEFDRNIREGTRTVSFAPAELAGLPDDFRKAHPPGTDGMVAITTDYPDYHPFMAYARSSRAREKLWRAYNTRASPANIEVLSRLLAKAYELATVLGYANWADYTTENKMIGTGRAASEFVERIATAASERSAKELPGCWRASERTSAREAGGPVGLRLLLGPGEDRAVPVRREGRTALLRVRPRAARSARGLGPPRSTSRYRPVEGTRSGTPRSGSTTSSPGSPLENARGSLSAGSTSTSIPGRTSTSTRRSTG